MKITLLEVGLHNKLNECVQEFFYGRNNDKLEHLWYEYQVLYYLIKSEVQLTELKGAKNGQRTRNI